jgi:hypothetical protein
MVVDSTRGEAERMSMLEDTLKVLLLLVDLRRCLRLPPDTVGYTAARFQELEVRALAPRPNSPARRQQEPARGIEGAASIGHWSRRTA